MNERHTDSRHSDDTPVRYRIVLEGSPGASFSTWFEDASVSTDHGQTVLEFSVADQSALHGMLRRIHDLHLKLVSLTRIA